MRKMNVRQENTNRVRLMLAVVGVAAGLTMGVLALASEGQQGGADVIAPNTGGLAQPTVDYGETSTATTAPSSPKTPQASPPVTAEPAPTEEPG